MELKDLLAGALVALLVFAAFLTGALLGRRTSIQCGEFIAGVTSALTWKGFLCATALPACWLLLFYTFVVHVRLSLGHWPQFGQHLEGWSFAFYDHATRSTAWALMGSLYVAPLVLVACLFVRRWRHVSVYAAAYATALVVAIGAMYWAPHSFLNWYFD
jgi:hypothetical protein